MTYTLQKSSLLHRLLPIAMLCVSAFAQGETWVITDQAHPVTNAAGIRVIRLDEQQRLEEQLTKKLPSNPTQAAASIQAYLSSPDGKQFQRELAQAQQAATDAWSLGVKKIPAVVVDRQYVVYGEADVKTATGIIVRARSMQR